jgi:hypothetical protein
MAIPLRKPPAGGRAENTNVHVAKDQDVASGTRLRPRRTAALLVVQVEGDLATEVDELKVGLDPLRTA